MGKLKQALAYGKHKLAVLFAPRRKGDIDDFLDEIGGVIHVGANAGQERQVYADRGLKVVWVEPIPDVFQTLTENIRTFPDQTALCYLVTDRDGDSFDFKIANNDGQSSSIFDLAQHKEIWPDVDYVDSIELTSTSFATMVEREGIDLDGYQGLVLDTQGSELLVLKGAGSLLRRFQYIKAEAADFEAYAGSCVIDVLKRYLGQHGFKEVQRSRFARGPANERYFDVLFSRT